MARAGGRADVLERGAGSRVLAERKAQKTRTRTCISPPPPQMTLAGNLHVSQQAACFEATEPFGVGGKTLMFK
jgi:hypothetical protein